MSEQSTTVLPRPGRRSWLGLGAAAAAVAVLVFLIAFACQAGSDDPDGAGALGSSSPVAGGSPSDGGGADGEADGEGSADGTGDSGQDGGGQGDGGQAATPAPAPAGPEIAYFRVAQEPRCPGGTTDFPVEGQPVVLEWSVTGTDEVSLSIDGSGVYNTYPAQGGDTIDYPCEAGEGEIQQHTYLLTAANADGTSTETLTVEAPGDERVEN